MTLSLLLSIAALAVSIVSASGVYFAPFVHNYVNTKNQQRESHKMEIRKHVFLPLDRGINHFIQNDVQAYLTAGFASIPSEDTIERYKRAAFDFKKAPTTISVTELPNTTDWFDDDLYSDLHCHNDTIYQEIERAGKEIKVKMPIHVEKHWRLKIRLYSTLKPFVTSFVKAEAEASGIYGMTEIEDISSVSTIIAMLKLLQADPDSTGLYNLMSRLAGKETILIEIEKIAADNDFIKMADDLLKVENEVLKLLMDLRSHINKEATSGSKLKGNCHYLGYNNPGC